MATIRSELKTRAAASEVWSAIRDIGALHTRLVPGFVVDTKLELGARVVTFANGDRARHYNAAVQVSELADGSTSVVWTTDFLPDDISGYLSQAIEAAWRR